MKTGVINMLRSLRRATIMLGVVLLILGIAMVAFAVVTAIAPEEPEGYGTHYHHRHYRSRSYFFFGRSRSWMWGGSHKVSSGLGGRVSSRSGFFGGGFGGK